MTTEAPTVIKFNQGWKPFTEQLIHEYLIHEYHDDGVTSSSELEGHGVVIAQLIPLETENRFHGLPLKEFIRGQERFFLEDRSILYLVRIILTTQDKKVSWEDYEEGISTLSCTLGTETTLPQVVAKGHLEMYYPKTADDTADGGRKIDISFDKWQTDPTKPDYDWDTNTPYAFSLTTSLTTADDLEFVFRDSLS